MGGFYRERSLQKIILLDDSLEKCRPFASNKDVAFLFLRLRSANCSKSKNAHDPANLAEA
jgi:hypothetical protein